MNSLEHILQRNGPRSLSISRPGAARGSGSMSNKGNCSNNLAESLAAPDESSHRARRVFLRCRRLVCSRWGEAVEARDAKRLLPTSGLAYCRIPCRVSRRNSSLLVQQTTRTPKFSQIDLKSSLACVSCTVVYFVRQGIIHSCSKQLQATSSGACLSPSMFLSAFRQGADRKSGIRYSRFQCSNLV